MSVPSPPLPRFPFLLTQPPPSARDGKLVWMQLKQNKRSLRAGRVIKMRTRSIGRFAVIILSAAAVAVGASYLLAYHTWLFPFVTAGTGFAAIALSVDRHIWLRPKEEKAEELSEHEEDSTQANAQHSSTTGLDRQRIGLVARWLVAVTVSVAGFALSWWGCLRLLHLDEAVSLGVAAAVLAMLSAVAAWWAPITADSEGTDDPQRIAQRSHEREAAYKAGRDQTISRRRRDE